jgi:hypothetical protein
VAEQLIGSVEQMNDHASVYDIAGADVYRDDGHPYTFAAGRERNAYTPTFREQPRPVTCLS